ncbi:hypothetical protein ACJQWK_08840 [Exserohilum turcicum]
MGRRPVSWTLMLLMIPLSALLFGPVNSTRTTKHKACGWELMQNFHIPIAHLGAWYAAQTGDGSLCTRQPDGSLYCTCIYECGNGIWSYVHAPTTTMLTTTTTTTTSSSSSSSSQQAVTRNNRRWIWEKGCNKYCHAAICDGQDPRNTLFLGESSSSSSSS